MSFEETSKTFQKALGMSNSKLYSAAIELYKEDLKENPKNIASMNNMAVAKIHFGISEGNEELLHEAKRILEETIKIVNDSEDIGYPIADANLKWVNEILNRK